MMSSRAHKILIASSKSLRPNCRGSVCRRDDRPATCTLPVSLPVLSVTVPLTRGSLTLPCCLSHVSSQTHRHFCSLSPPPAPCAHIVPTALQIKRSSLPWPWRPTQPGPAVHSSLLPCSPDLFSLSVHLDFPLRTLCTSSSLGPEGWALPALSWLLLMLSWLTSLLKAHMLCFLFLP